MNRLLLLDEAGVLDEPYSAKPTQRSSHTDPPARIRIFNCIEEVPRFFFSKNLSLHSRFPTTFSSTVHHTQFNFYSWANNAWVQILGWHCTMGVSLDWAILSLRRLQPLQEIPYECYILWMCEWKKKNFKKIARDWSYNCIKDVEIKNSFYWF